jgi:hypothetical protein
VQGYEQEDESRHKRRRLCVPEGTVSPRLTFVDPIPPTSPFSDSLDDGEDSEDEGDAGSNRLSFEEMLDVGRFLFPRYEGIIVRVYARGISICTHSVNYPRHTTRRRAGVLSHALIAPSEPIPELSPRVPTCVRRVANDDLTGSDRNGERWRFSHSRRDSKVNCD